MNLVRWKYETKADDGKLLVAIISNENTAKNTEYSFLANVMADPCGNAARDAGLSDCRGRGSCFTHLPQSWFVAWIMMLPIVLYAAPAIRNLTHILTRED